MRRLLLLLPPLLLSLLPLGGVAADVAAAAAIDYEDTWVLRYVAAMPDGYPRQVRGQVQALGLCAVRTWVYIDATARL